LGNFLVPLLRGSPLYILAFVLISRSMVSGLVLELKPVALFGMLLVACGFFWVCAGVVSRTVRWRGGWLAAVYFAFMVWMLIAALGAHNLFAAAKVWWLFATYGLTAFLVIQLADSPCRRWFLVCCVLATAVTLAAYALFHLAVYVPAMKQWVQREPEYFQSLFEARGGRFKELLSRAGGARACGSFLTANQLANFLLLGLFPLCGLTAGLYAAWRKGSEGGRQRPPAVLCVAAAAAGLVVLALFFSGSKGGGIAFVFGVLVFAVGGMTKWARRHAWKLGAAAGALFLAFLFAMALGFAPSPRQFAASLGVRVHYWSTSTQMIHLHPALGVGPGCWEEHYAMLKAPEYEETKLAHNAYLQVWSETGTPGVVLFAFLWVLFGASVLRGMARAPLPPVVGGAEDAVRSRLSRWGILLGAVAMVHNWLFVGTFSPPEVGVPKLLSAAPWMVNLALLGVWAGTFRLLHDKVGESGRLALPAARRLVLWGLAAGLAAFLLHSGAEFTFRVPAIGSAAFALASLLLMEVAPPRQRQMHLAHQGPAAALLACALAVALGWSLVVVHAQAHGLAKDKAFARKRELSSLAGGDPRWSEAAMGVFEAWGEAVEAVPWDDECHYQRAKWAARLADVTRDVREGRALLIDAEAAARRAIELNPLKAAHWEVLGDVLLRTGPGGEAVACLRRAAELYPALPRRWLKLGEVIETSEGLTREACDAYRKALELSPPQYHDRNKLSEQQAEQLREKLRHRDEQ